MSKRTKRKDDPTQYTFANTEDLLNFLNVELLSTVEAAELLGISKARLGQLVKDGKLKAAKEQPKIFLKSTVIEKKDELELLRKKYRPYDE